MVDEQDLQAGLPRGADAAQQAQEQRTIAELNSRRKAFRVVATTGFLLAPAMFFLPLALSVLSGGDHPGAIVTMTAAWAVLVSAISFAVMASTKPGGHPWVHQIWAVPAAIIAMIPGAMTALVAYGLLVGAL
ncbi:hypothetical protein [uncultured Curtobacterium sp.]|uniref:hypothetical protein n=1 Tax=uncultured Curtobacterium sp. TaxID=331964 RepID=UPI00258DCF33|nr:hypothetical protein [uncultured Curtobacterium sp.]